jgi:hypothetical protein
MDEWMNMARKDGLFRVNFCCTSSILRYLSQRSRIWRLNGHFIIFYCFWYSSLSKRHIIMDIAVPIWFPLSLWR